MSFTGRLFKRRPKTCAIHHCELVNGVAKVLYGLVRTTEEERAARNALFPNANSFFLGGCKVGPYKERSVQFCLQCRQAEVQWHQHKHGY